MAWAGSLPSPLAGSGRCGKRVWRVRRWHLLRAPFMRGGTYPHTLPGESPQGAPESVKRVQAGEYIPAFTPVLKCGPARAEALFSVGSLPRRRAHRALYIRGCKNACLYHFGAGARPYARRNGLLTHFKARRDTLRRDFVFMCQQIKRVPCFSRKSSPDRIRAELPPCFAV